MNRHSSLFSSFVAFVLFCKSLPFLSLVPPFSYVIPFSIFSVPGATPSTINTQPSNYLALGYLQLQSYFVRNQARIVIMQKMSLLRSLTTGSGILLAAALTANVSAQNAPAGDATRGKAFFEINCAVCHSPVLGPDNLVVMK